MFVTGLLRCFLCPILSILVIGGLSHAQPLYTWPFPKTLAYALMLWLKLKPWLHKNHVLRKNRGLHKTLFCTKKRVMYKNHVLHPKWICILFCKNRVMFCRWKRLPSHVFIYCARILATGNSRIEGDTCLFHRRAVFLAMAFSCFQWIVGGGLRGSFKIPSPSTGLPVGSQSGKFLEILGRCEKTHIVRRIASDAQAGTSS